MKTQVFRIVMIWTMILLPAWGQAQSEPEVFAEVNGEAVTRAQVLERAAPALENLNTVSPRPGTYDRDRLEILWNALNSVVEERLIALEAVSLDLTSEQLLFIEVDSNVTTPSDAQVEAFYEENQEQIPIPREEALPQVREYLVDQARAGLRGPMIQRYRQKYGVTEYLDPLRTEVATAGYPSRGPDEAPVTIVEFGDFQCPFCGSLHPVMERVREIYPDTVRIVFRNFPLRNIHPRAQEAAEAAMCANEQGRFWDYHDSLFEQQNMLAIGALRRRAVEMGMDTELFNACLESGRMAEAVQRDVDEERAAGVTGKPTLFINGRYLSGPQPSTIQAIIEDELDRSGIER